MNTWEKQREGDAGVRAVLLRRLKALGNRLGAEAAMAAFRPRTPSSPREEDPRLLSLFLSLSRRACANSVGVCGAGKVPLSQIPTGESCARALSAAVSESTLDRHACESWREVPDPSAPSLEREKEREKEREIFRAWLFRDRSAPLSAAGSLFSFSLGAAARGANDSRTCNCAAASTLKKTTDPYENTTAWPASQLSLVPPCAGFIPGVHSVSREFRWFLFRLAGQDAQSSQMFSPTPSTDTRVLSKKKGV